MPGANNRKQDNTLSDTTPSLRIGRLDTPSAVRAELARLYKQARRNAGTDITPADASKLAHILGTVWRSLEMSALEQRLASLEQKGKP